MTRANSVRWAIAALAIGLAWIVASPRGAVALRADPTNPLQDTDDDFLPDVVEWACLTNANNPDTDSDGVSDFVEVVQRGNPRRAGVPRPADHEMRVVVTSTELPTGIRLVCLHLLFRFMGDASLLTSLQTWVEFGMAPGLRISLDTLGSAPLSVSQRAVPDEGLWATVTIPLASEALLRCLLPCTIGANATIGTRSIVTAVPLFDMAGSTATLVPYAEDRYAVQSIGPSGAIAGGGTNRVCVLELTQLQAVPGGTAYRVNQADCDDCNDLECGAACSLAEGWIFVLPGGLGAITGG